MIALTARRSISSQVRIIKLIRSFRSTRASGCQAAEITATGYERKTTPTDQLVMKRSSEQFNRLTRSITGDLNSIDAALIRTPPPAPWRSWQRSPPLLPFTKNNLMKINYYFTLTFSLCSIRSLLITRVLINFKH